MLNIQVLKETLDGYRVQAPQPIDHLWYTIGREVVALDKEEEQIIDEIRELEMRLKSSKNRLYRNREKQEYAGNLFKQLNLEKIEREVKKDGE